MNATAVSRRTLMGGALGLAAYGGAANAAPKLPDAPVTLTVVDAGGSLQMLKPGLESFRQENPSLVSRIDYTLAPPVEAASKIRSQQAAGRMEIDLVLCGFDSLAAGIAGALWTKLLPDYSSSLPDLEAIYLPGAWRSQALAEGQGVAVVFCPSGPLLEYMPARLAKPPASAEELLAYTRTNPNKFCYGRPSNSGPGHTFIEGLPYILGDKDPLDPANGWDRTWSYLAELGQNIDYYPAGTGLTMKELAEGTRDIIVTITGWDINPRVLGIVPKEAQISTLRGFHWIPDAQFMCIPKGVSESHLGVLLRLVSYMLGQKAQAYTYDSGFLYPGPAVKDITIDMAPAESQRILKEFGRPSYDALIADVPMEVGLSADRLVYAFRRWDQQIGSKSNGRP